MKEELWLINGLVVFLVFMWLYQVEVI